MRKLLSAIVEDNASAVETLLMADGGLTAALIGRPKLYDSSIFHWIYTGDSALHLAAAGYRVEIVRILLAAGADPNAAQNELQAVLPQVLPAPPSGPPIAVTFPAAIPAGAAARHPVGMTRQAQKTYTRVQRHESRSPTRGGSG